MPSGIVRRLLAGLLLSLHGAVAGEAGTTFITVGPVDLLSVLNRYQQTAAVADRRVLEPFAPLRVLRATMLLADGFTRVMHVEAGGEELYLLTDPRGTPLGAGSAGALQIYRDAVPLSDTVVVLTGAVRFTPLSSPPLLLPRGTKLGRSFAYEGRDYCRLTADSALYGWVVLPAREEGTTWARSVSKALPLRATIPPDAVRRIRDRIAGVNRALTSLYGRLAAETGVPRKAPEWQVSEDRGGLLCTLDGAADPDRFRESTSALAREVENMLLGTTLRVTEQPGRIEVRVR